MTPTPRSWRCSRCGLNWPFYRQYEVCLQCEEKCSGMDNQEPMADATADEIAGRLRADRQAEMERLAKHMEFEKYYAEREAARLRDELEDWAANFAKLGSLPTTK